MAEIATFDTLVSDASAYVDKYQRYFIVGGVLAIVIIAIIYTFYQIKLSRFQNIDGTDAFVVYDNQSVDVSGRPSIQASTFAVPTVPRNFTYSMWLNITDWYTNYGHWKHVFHRGTNVSTSCSTEPAYDTVPHQCPGIWLGDVTNDLRISVSTMVPSASSEANTYVEYAELKNFPVGEWANLVVVFHDQAIDIYLNGNLRTTKLLTGKMMMNNDPGYIGIGSTVAAKLSTFRYMATSLTANEVQDLFRREKYTYSTIVSDAVKYSV